MSPGTGLKAVRLNLSCKAKDHDIGLYYENPMVHEDKIVDLLSLGIGHTHISNGYLRLFLA